MTLDSKLNGSYTTVTELYNKSMQPTAELQCPLQRDSAAADLNSYLASQAIDSLCNLTF